MGMGGAGDIVITMTHSHTHTLTHSHTFIYIYRQPASGGSVIFIALLERRGVDGGRGIAGDGVVLFGVYHVYIQTPPYFLVCGSDRRLGRQMLVVEQLGSSEAMIRWDINYILPVSLRVLLMVYPTDKAVHQHSRSSMTTRIHDRQHRKPTSTSAHFLHTPEVPIQYTPIPHLTPPLSLPFSCCHAPAPSSQSQSQSSPTPDARFPESSSTQTHTHTRPRHERTGFADRAPRKFRNPLPLSPFSLSSSF